MSKIKTFELKHNHTNPLTMIEQVSLSNGVLFLVSIFKSNTLQYRNVSYWMQFLSYSNTCILHIDFLKIDKLYFTYKLLLLLYTNHAVHSIYSLYYEDFSIEEAFQYFF